MSWFDTLLLNALPVLVVMSLLAAVIPTAKGPGVWRGIGLAWLSAFGVGLVIALTHIGQWQLSCNLPGPLGFYRPTNEPCGGANAIPLWMSQLPLLIGIAILLGWYLRNVRPWRAAARVVASILLLTAAIVGVGQLNPNLGLLLFAVVVAAMYAWPRLQRPKPSSRLVPR